MKVEIGLKNLDEISVHSKKFATLDEVIKWQKILMHALIKHYAIKND